MDTIRVEDDFKRAVSDHWPEVVYDDVLDAEEVGTGEGCLGPVAPRGTWGSVSLSRWGVVTDGYENG